MPTSFYRGLVFIVTVSTTIALLWLICKLTKKEKFETKTPEVTQSPENQPAPLELTAIEVAETKNPSIWNYYGSKSDYLMDQVAKGFPVPYGSQITRGIYCDRPNRNRSFLVNPIITQKNIFIKPHMGQQSDLVGIPSYDRRQMASWQRSATDVHPELAWQIDPVFGLADDNVFYTNFSDTVRRLKKGNIKLFADDYKYRCGIGKCGGQPKDTLNNDY